MNLEKLKGKFITFEGGEGVGKTTQSKLMVEYLKDNKLKAEWTREPGGCDAAEKIRNLLFSKDVEWDAMTEMLMMYAARREHTEKKIKPALNRGEIIVSDRYLDSTMAYQGYAENLDKKAIKLASKIVLGDFKPDLTIILDLDVNESLERTVIRGLENRFDEKELDFHKKIRKGFLEIAEDNKNRIIVLNVSKKNIKEVQTDILNILIKKFDLF
ncbi:MAG: dTMP kinase [Rickettsiales bacterium]|jgi:dTMP kinase|nr:dTMP kinase [Rickettsiales bacterium]